MLLLDGGKGQVIVQNIAQDEKTCEGWELVVTYESEEDEEVGRSFIYFLH